MAGLRKSMYNIINPIILIEAAIIIILIVIWRDGIMGGVLIETNYFQELS